MTLSGWIWIAVGAILVFFLLPTMLMSGIIYTVLLVRTKPEKWDRSCSIPDDEEYVGMFREGLAWEEKWKEHKQPVSIVSDGLKLVGEYFDFGGKRAVIIVPGRMESLLYSYYFAEPYRQEGCNVLVIDNRSHGLSEGKVSCLGFREYRDLQAWSRMLSERFGNTQVVLHGICIGASASLFALTDRNCPDCLCGMVADGMYTTFCESFKNHMIEDKHPLFPFVAEVMLYIRLISHANVVTDGPVKRICQLQKPILFIHSRADSFSLPEKAQQLFDACPAEKRLEWFEVGAHSRVRVNNPERYDRVIREFLCSPALSEPSAEAQTEPMMQ